MIYYYAPASFNLSKVIRRANLIEEALFHTVKLIYTSCCCCSLRYYYLHKQPIGLDRSNILFNTESSFSQWAVWDKGLFISIDDEDGVWFAGQSCGFFPDPLF